MAKNPSGASTVQGSEVSASASEPSPAAGSAVRLPPQTQGVPGDIGNAEVGGPPQSAGTQPKMFNLGAPPRYRKYSVTMQILANPEAKRAFYQPYSGQRREWQK